MLLFTWLQYFLLLKIGFSQLMASTLTLPALPHKKEDIFLQTPFWRIPRKDFGQVFVMCPPWTKSYGQGAGGLLLAHLRGCAVHCIQDGKVTREGGSSIWTNGQSSGGANLERMWVLFSKGKEDARQTKLTVQTNAAFGTTLHFHIPMNQQCTSLGYFPWLWYSLCVILPICLEGPARTPPVHHGLLKWHPFHYALSLN